MSTKIYNGYRVHGIDRPADLFAFLDTYRTDALDEYRRTFTQALCIAAARLVDEIDLGKDVELRANSPLLTAWHIFQDAHNEIARTGHRNPRMDFGVELALLADPDNPTGPLFALLYTEQQGQVDVFTRQNQVEAWPYWNNTDRPGDVTADDWDQRRDTWNRALRGKHVPAEAGVTWKLLSDGHEMPFLVGDGIALIAESIPTLEERARVIAADQVVAEAVGMVEPEEIRQRRDKRAAELAVRLRETLDEGMLRSTAAPTAGN